MVGTLENKNAKLKEDLAVLDLRLHDKDEEISNLKIQNLDLQKRLFNIAESKEYPVIERMEKMMDAKLENLTLWHPSNCRL